MHMYGFLYIYIYAYLQGYGFSTCKDAVWKLKAEVPPSWQWRFAEPLCFSFFHSCNRFCILHGTRIIRPLLSQMHVQPCARLYKPPFLCDLLQERTVSHQPNTSSKLDTTWCIGFGEPALKDWYSGLEQNRNILTKYLLSEDADSSKWSFLQKRASSSGIFLWHYILDSFQLKCFIWEVKMTFLF